MRHCGVEHVFVNMVARAGMNEQHIMLKVAVRQSAQPLEPLGSNHFNSPTHDRSRVVVEPFKNLRVGACPIVISDQRGPLSLCHLVYASAWITAITDDITKANRFVDRPTVKETG